jgi:copper resistance protein B
VRALACLLSLGLANGAAAQMNHDHAGHGAPPSSVPAAAPAGGDPGDAAPFGAPVMDQHVFYHLMLNQLEGRFGETSSFRWSGEGWLGTDEHRLWLRSEGTLSGGKLEDGQHELLYARPISTWFNAMIGGRYDGDSGPGRGWGAIGIEGLAPLFFRVAATGYIGGDGRLAARLEGSYDLLLTQQLVLQPQVEMNFYSKADAERDLGSGLAEIDAGLRLRYEITRKVAPYVGVTYSGKFGGTADFARAAGHATDEVRFTLGLRTWF